MRGYRAVSSTATANLSRVRLHAAAEIPASANDLWTLISDWAGMLRWRLPAEEGGLLGPVLVSCDLIGAHGAVPRTRRMTFANGAVVEEELLYQNDETRRIYYRKSPAAESGYVASTYVDEIEAERSLVHVTSQFDVRPEADPPAVIARFEAIYRGMFNGYRAFFRNRDDVAPARDGTTS